jgi:hypothetical protein
MHNADLLPLLFALQDSTKHARSGMKAEQIAELMGIGYSTLMNKVAPNVHTHRLSLAEFSALIRYTQDDRLLFKFAAAHGYLIIPMPTGVVGNSEAARTAVQATARFGEVMRSFDHATDPDGPDGQRISDDELKKFQDAGLEAQSYLARFMEAVKTMREES